MGSCAAPSAKGTDKFTTFRFLQQSQAKLLRFTPEVAEHCGADLDEMRRDEATKLFVEYANARGRDHIELAVEMTISSEQRRQLEVIQNYHKTIAEQIGMSWEEYLEINPKLAYLK